MILGPVRRSGIDLAAICPSTHDTRTGQRADAPPTLEVPTVGECVGLACPGSIRGTGADDVRAASRSADEGFGPQPYRAAATPRASTRAERCEAAATCVLLSVLPLSRLVAVVVRHEAAGADTALGVLASAGLIHAAVSALLSGRRQVRSRVDPNG